MGVGLAHGDNEALSVTKLDRLGCSLRDFATLLVRVERQAERKRCLILPHSAFSEQSLALRA